MSRRKQSFTEKRRARLAMKWDRLEKLETKSTITEPISVAGSEHQRVPGAGASSASCRPTAATAHCSPWRGSRSRPVKWPCPHKRPRFGRSTRFRSDWFRQTKAHRAGGGGMQDATATGSTRRPIPTADLRPDLAAAPNPSQQQGISAPWHPAAPTAGGGALPPRGGSGGSSPALVAAASGIHSTARASSSPKNAPNSAAGSSAAASSAALLSTLGLSASGAASPTVSAGYGERMPQHRRPPSAAMRWPQPEQWRRRDTGSRMPGLSPAHLAGFRAEDARLQRRLGHGPRLRPARHARRQRRPPRPGPRLGHRDLYLLLEHERPHRRHQHQRHEHATTSPSTGTPPSPRPRPNPSRSPSPTPTSTRSARPTPSGSRPAPARRPAARPGTTRRSTPACSRPAHRPSPARTSRSSRTPAPSRRRSTCPATTRISRALSLNYDSLAANALPIIVAEHAARSQPEHALAGLGPVDLRRHRRHDLLLRHQSVCQPGDIMQIGLQADATTLTPALPLHDDDRRHPRRHAHDLHLHRQRHRRKRRRGRRPSRPWGPAGRSAAWRRSSRPPAG